MAKIGDWKKVQEDYWENSRGDAVHIDYTGKSGILGRGYRFYVGWSVNLPTDERIVWDTKEEARKYAVNWMKKHSYWRD